MKYDAVPDSPLQDVCHPPSSPPPRARHATHASLGITQPSKEAPPQRKPRFFELVLRKKKRGDVYLLVQPLYRVPLDPRSGHAPPPARPPPLCLATALCEIHLPRSATALVAPTRGNLWRRPTRSPDGSAPGRPLRPSQYGNFNIILDRWELDLVGWGGGAR